MFVRTSITRGIQGISLGVFYVLMWQTVFPLFEGFIPVDIFLRIDPLITTLVPLMVKEYIPPLLIGLVVFFLTLLGGRIFCGFICPMGTTLDLSRAILAPSKNVSISLPHSLGHIKYLFVTALAVAAFCGVNHFFWGSPIALITRFYALLIHPLLLLLGNLGISSLRPLLEMQDISLLTYMHITPRVYHSVYFLTAFFTLLFFLERVRPRFWCRYLCPAGAILAICSWRPLWKRQVIHCTHCKKCVRTCPMGAIGVMGNDTQHSQCIGCQTCVHTCPVNAVRFTFAQKTQESSTPLHIAEHSVSTNTQTPQPLNITNAKHVPSRRAFLWASLCGATMGGLAFTSAASFMPSKAKASLLHAGLIRPPGARPEADFLTRCLRCGQCMKVCPTNGLQPTWMNNGFEGIFSPALQSRIGPCEPECNACGHVCPTEAIIPLPLADKRQAKIGTAVVYPELCLAWAENRSCVVCQEVCPYGAIKIQSQQGNSIPVPVITQTRCYGCGFCEKHCPVRIPAIVVQPLNALRLEANTYADAANAAGLDLVPVSLRPHQEHSEDEIPDGQLPPGFVD